jgi:large subunit ribosomal protein L13
MRARKVVCRHGQNIKKQMDTLSYKTVSANKATAQKGWVVVDAEGQVLGRMCSKVAKILRGKYKPNFTPNVDCGDNVIIINAEKVQLTGNKWNDRVYVRYTGFPGGQREMTPAQLLEKGADRLIKKVVKGMLPKNRLGRQIIGNLYVFEGAEHDKQAQQPVQIDINTLK